MALIRYDDNRQFDFAQDTMRKDSGGMAASAPLKHIKRTVRTLGVTPISVADKDKKSSVCGRS